MFSFPAGKIVDRSPDGRPRQDEGDPAVDAADVEQSDRPDRNAKNRDRQTAHHQGKGTGPEKEGKGTPEIEETG